MIHDFLLPLLAERFRGRFIRGGAADKSVFCRIKLFFGNLTKKAADGGW